LRRDGHVGQTEPEASWDLTHSGKVPLAVSMPSAEDHRRLLRDYADATERFPVRRPGHDIGVKDWERD
jgi:hypothetical protein